MPAGPAAAVSFALLLSLAACAAPKPPAAPTAFHDDSAVVISTDQLSTPPFTVLQHVRGKIGTQDIAFECTVRFSHGKLSLVGITPYGARAFSVEQVGSDVQAQAFEPDDLPFGALQVLVDVHRAFFRGLPQPQPNGEHERDVRAAALP